MTKTALLDGGFYDIMVLIDSTDEEFNMSIRRKTVSGSTEQGKKAAATLKARYGSDFYRMLGSKGGKKTHADGAKPKGFAAMTLEKRSAAGRKGGLKSRKP